MFSIVDSKFNRHYMDEDDFNYFKQWLWIWTKGGYAYRENKGKRLYLHVEVAKRASVFVEGLEIDHKDRDSFNDRRDNLRPATRSQQMLNRARPDCNSFYRGVVERRGRFLAYYYSKRTQISLGTFDTAEQAARSRDSSVKRLFGDRAILNFPEET
jgi:hypothetical protein